MSFEGFLWSAGQWHDLSGMDSRGSSDTGKSILATDVPPSQGFACPASVLHSVIPSQSSLRVGVSAFRPTSSKSDSAAYCVAQGCSSSSSRLSFPTLGNGDNEKCLTELWVSRWAWLQSFSWCQDVRSDGCRGRRNLSSLQGVEDRKHFVLLR